MKNHPSSPAPFANANAGQHASDHAPRRDLSDPGDAAQRPKRPRAPQFGTDRRNQRDRDAARPRTTQYPGGRDQPLRQDETSDDNRGNRERRKATEDRRQSWQNVRKEAFR